MNEAPSPESSSVPESSRVTEPSTATVTLDIESSPEAVWDALVTDQGLAAWMGDGAVAGSEPGATFFVPDVVTGQRRRGRIGGVESGERLDYTWWHEDDPSTETNVAITLEPCEAGTRITVVETMPTAQATSSDAKATASASGLALSVGVWTWRVALLSVAATVLLTARVS